MKRDTDERYQILSDGVLVEPNTYYRSRAQAERRAARIVKEFPVLEPLEVRRVTWRCEVREP